MEEYYGEQLKNLNEKDTLSEIRQLVSDVEVDNYQEKISYPKLNKPLNFKELLERGSAEFEVDATGFGSDDEEWDSIDADNDQIKNVQTDSYQSSKTTKSIESLPWFNNIDTLPEQNKLPQVQASRTHTTKYKFSRDVTGWRFVTDDGGVLKNVIASGNGMKPTESARVWVHYEIFTENGRNLQSSKKGDQENGRRKEPLSFILGQHSVIEGLEFAVSSMEVKEIAEFLVSFDYAYGALGVPKFCDPYQNCLLKVELVDCMASSSVMKEFELDQNIWEQWRPKEVFQAATELKLLGNRCIANEKFEEALKHYRKTSFMLERAVIVAKDEDIKRRDLLFATYNNMAHCYLKQKDGRKVVEMCLKAKDLSCSNEAGLCKLYFRMASGLKLLEKIEEAKSACLLAIKIEPKNAAAKLLYDSISEQCSMNEKNSAVLYKKMSKGLSECFAKIKIDEAKN